MQEANEEIKRLRSIVSNAVAAANGFERRVIELERFLRVLSEDIPVTTTTELLEEINAVLQPNIGCPAPKAEYLRALREVRADIVFERKKVPLGRNTPNTLDMYERQLLLNIDEKIAGEMK